VRRLDHAGEGSRDRTWVATTGRVMEDRDGLLIEDDVDLVAHQAVRHAVTHRIDIDERMGRDSAAQPLLAAWQRPHPQRPERRALVAIKPHSLVRTLTVTSRAASNRWTTTALRPAATS
jgi:hypothetical protein